MTKREIVIERTITELKKREKKKKMRKSKS